VGTGPPFAAQGPAGLTKLAVWLLRLGIRLERITPGRPQENGRHERFHRTLADAVASPARANARAQQRALDLFRREYNEERPHEALGQVPPAELYVASSRRNPCGLLPPGGSSFGHIERVDNQGAIRWHRKRLFISTALCGAYVQLEPDAGTRWAVLFGGILLGHLDATKPEAGLLATPCRRKSHVLQLQRA
jgi:putative transposase